MIRKTNPLCLLLVAGLLAACSNIKYLKPGQNLYTGAEIVINPDSSGRVKDEKGLKAELKSKTRPKPNKKILGLRPKLYIYNIAGEPKKKKGLRHWLRTKVGEPPVLSSEVRLKLNNDVLRSNLISQGYLQATVTGDTVTKNRKTKAIYTANTGQRYKINRVTFPPDSSPIAAIVNANKEKSLLKPGSYYSLDVFKQERERIDNDLKEKGFFYFSPDYMILKVDSTIGKHEVNVNLRVKETTPDASLKPYTINNIRIYPNYYLNLDSVIRRTKPVQYKDFEIYDRRNTFKPQVFERMIFFNKGDVYNRRDHNLSLNRLVNLNTFKFVKAEFNPVDSFKNNQLDLSVYLTPLKRNSLSLAVTGTSKSNNFVGSEVTLTQLTRNVFRGAEQLNISVGGGFETQVKGTQAGVSSYSLSAEGKLSFPRFITPFFEPKSTSAFVPKTNVTLGFQLINRANYFSMGSAKGEFGYNWKESAFKEHVLNPISINFVKLISQTDSFRLARQNNPVLFSTYENQFIIGSNYTYTYNNQIDQTRRNNLFFMGNVQTAGNVVGLFFKEKEDGSKRLFNTSLTQFVRFEADLRDYFKITRGLTWANRLNLGYGYAYGNSSSLPFVRQFFAGGSNDIRAFAARSLGPGTYRVSPNALFADQGGDVKMMLNTELRAKLVSVLYGALFVDAGNVWLRREDPLRPGSQFRLSNAFDELAVGTGAGLRVDASIFVVRLDLAFPIRKPYLPEGQRWVFDEVAFGDKGWRRENLILNIGIGYPF
ncbi:BamA/TamA family outer membrane protein [Pedobacter sp. SYP-B3415]|uniref:translocation and assembly module lipoprotein TamL n=1 Tax=Pedobacter sp. SYP-B3415 TaxID=2496641 RepID=UPI00101B76BF|nr:BamA/TamA family outer membrane protein [Pedobacter sp. SYP-B3415]